MPNSDDRLTLLEQAQLLHDATLRRHGEMLDRHATDLALMRDLLDRQQSLMEVMVGLVRQHQERMDRLDTLLQAIKAMLERGNGH